jgi:hypothetical protein
MISIIPALDFMRGLGGTYRAVNGHAELRIWSCGYGVALDLRGERKPEMVGVIGAYGEVIECLAQIGLPNVIRLVGRKVTDACVRFEADDIGISMTVSRELAKVHIAIALDGDEKRSYILQLRSDI